MLGGQPVHAVQQAQPLRRDLLVEVAVSPSRCSVPAAMRRSSTSSSARRDISASVSSTVRPGGQVVGDDEVELVVDVAVELVELQAEQPGVDAELDDHRLDLVGDAVHHLAALQHGDDVAQRDDVLDLERRSGWRCASSRRTL